MAIIAAASARKQGMERAHALGTEETGSIRSDMSRKFCTTARLLKLRFGETADATGYSASIRFVGIQALYKDNELIKA